MSSTSSCSTPCHFKKPKFPFRKTSLWKFLDVKLARFAVRIALAATMENNGCTVAELGKGVLYFINTSTQLCRYIKRKNVCFCKLQRKIPTVLLLCGFAIDFNFFYRKSANVCCKKSFRKSKLWVRNLLVCGQICGSAQQGWHAPEQEVIFAYR